jgi:hypothetical protein
MTSTEESKVWGKAAWMMEMMMRAKRECGNWDYSDSQRCDTPEFLLCVSGERKVPPRTVNATEDDAKGNQEQDVVPLGISMLWNVERGDVRVVRGEGR